MVRACIQYKGVACTRMNANTKPREGQSVDRVSVLIEVKQQARQESNEGASIAFHVGSGGYDRCSCAPTTLLHLHYLYEATLDWLARLPLSPTARAATIFAPDWCSLAASSFGYLVI